MRIINCFYFSNFVPSKYSVKEFYKHTEGNSGLMGMFSKQNTYQAYVDYLYFKMLTMDIGGLVSD